MRRVASWTLAAAMLVVAAVPAAAVAQASLGHPRPADLQPLLDDRLPTWGWSTWVVSGRLGGNGDRRDSEGRDLEDRRTSEDDESHYRGELSSAWSWYREGEQRVWSLAVDLDGSCHRDWRHGTDRSSTESGIREREFTESGPVGRYQTELGIVQYLLAGDLAAVLNVQGTGAYRQIHQTLRYDDWPRDEHNSMDRKHRYAMAPGVSYGRLRDVTPLVLAARLSERLQALGRPALSRLQVRQVAEALARQAGYQAVFDRPDKRFWRKSWNPSSAARRFRWPRCSPCAM
ncbi:MAG: hypothetical protein R3D98_10365 [Candidatus Krumholzibacteriia bacterium]